MSTAADPFPSSDSPGHFPDLEKDGDKIAGVVSVSAEGIEGEAPLRRQLENRHGECGLGGGDLAGDDRTR